jgi:nucleoside-diphosphate-sugar epimerase
MHPYNKGIPVPGWEPRISLHEGIRDFIHSNQESKT